MSGEDAKPNSRAAGRRRGLRFGVAALLGRRKSWGEGPWNREDRTRGRVRRRRPGEAASFDAPALLATALRDWTREGMATGGSPARAPRRRPVASRAAFPRVSGVTGPDQRRWGPGRGGAPGRGAGEAGGEPVSEARGPAGRPRRGSSWASANLRPSPDNAPPQRPGPFQALTSHRCGPPPWVPPRAPRPGPGPQPPSAGRRS